jgi:hypothetical protein
MKQASLISTLAAAALCLSVLQGCSSTQTQTKVERTTTSTAPDDGATTTTTTTTDSQNNSDQHDSVLGATANAVGTVIAAPFRLVGDAFEIVF